jgi:LmbE family N-acetylglucosaminyl deacetylase
MDTLRLQLNERILIIAPHPDDEVLACGGLIQQALALGDSVRVIYVTSGDGAWPSVTVITGCLFPGNADYVELGRARMDEARRGAEALGLAPGAPQFLGYPDDGLAPLWQEHWLTPVASSHTGATRDPYATTDREYRGTDVVTDLTDILTSFRPDRVFAPHPCDAHPDHWSTAMLLEITRETWRLSRTNPFPAVFRYLIHHPPYPRGSTASDNVLSPPDDLTGPMHKWFTLPLSDPVAPWIDTLAVRKTDALECHESQLALAGDNLYDFITANELFDSAVTETGAVTEDAPRGPYTWLAGDRLFDTVSVRMQGDSLFARVALFGESRLGLDYALYLHCVARTGDSVVQSGMAVELATSSRIPGEAKPVSGVISVAKTDRHGWTFALPSLVTGQTGTILYTADARFWGSELLSHSGIGRVTY